VIDNSIKRLKTVDDSCAFSAAEAMRRAFTQRAWSHRSRERCVKPILPLGLPGRILME
jgi:hypothetical protein